MVFDRLGQCRARVVPRAACGLSQKEIDDIAALFDDEIYRAFREHDVPRWYVESCEKIEYLFPKAHAAALATAAVKLAVLKVYYPIEFYAAVLADRVYTVKLDIIVNEKEAVTKRLDTLREKARGGEISAWEYDEIGTLRIFLEAIAQGVSRSG